MPSKGFTHHHLHSQYGRLLADISGLLEQARRTAARSVNAVLTATYWQIGRRIVEHEQHGTVRAEYGGTLMQQLARDLTARHGRGFSIQGLYKMRGFYLGWEILQTPSGKPERCSAAFRPEPRLTLARRRRDRNGRVGLAPPIPLETWFLVGQAPPYILSAPAPLRETQSFLA